MYVPVADSLGRAAETLEGGHGNPLQYSCLENATGRRPWQAIVLGVGKEPDTAECIHGRNWLNIVEQLYSNNIFKNK